MDITELRKRIDEIDRKLVGLINERARAAQQIGRLKRRGDLPIYEPDREKTILANVASVNRGPLTEKDLRHIYERLIDVMRNIQKVEIAPEEKPVVQDTELEQRD